MAEAIFVGGDGASDAGSLVGMRVNRLKIVPEFLIVMCDEIGNLGGAWPA